MPTYQYACTSSDCGNEFELVQSFTDPSASECPVCGGPVRKVFSAVGVVFKGSGFYRNDSRSATGGPDATKASEPSSSTSPGSTSSDGASSGDSSAKGSDGSSPGRSSSDASKTQSSTGSSANASSSSAKKAAAPA